MFLPLQIMGFLQRMAFASAGRAVPVEEDNTATSEDSLHQKRDKPKTKVCHHRRPQTRRGNLDPSGQLAAADANRTPSAPSSRSDVRFLEARFDLERVVALGAVLIAAAMFMFGYPHRFVVFPRCKVRGGIVTPRLRSDRWPNNRAYEKSRPVDISLHVRIHESVGPLLCVLRCLFVVFHVLTQHLHRLLKRYVEGMGGAGIDRHPTACNREPARRETYLRPTAGSQRHFNLVKVLL
jgi:hypothetical protein